MTNWYGNLPDLKTRRGITDTVDDTLLTQVLETVSREIDQFCQRQFYVSTRTLHFTHRGRWGSYLPLAVPDLLAVTTLKTDPGGTRTYTDTWATTDYDLLPEDAPYQSPPHPYWQIGRNINGDFSFPTFARGVEVAGKWGFYEVLSRSSTTLGAAITDTTGTSVTFSATPQVKVGQTLLIDAEQMFLSGLSTVTGTVVRGVNGTTATTHSNAAAIDVYTYPIVSEACYLQVNQVIESGRAPGGMLGGGDIGLVRIPSLHPLVMSMLSPLRLRGVA